MQWRESRRQFLKSAALVAGGLSSGQVRAGGGSVNEKLNLGIIGAAGRGGNNLREVGQTENIVALCDIDELRLGKAAEEHPRAAKYRDFRKMLEREKLDAVVVSTPDHTHAVASVMAMKMGKHVYCEKPLAHSVWEARVMAETARKHRVVTQMGNQLHASDRLRRVVELVQAGTIGTVREVVAWSSKVFSGGDRPKETPAVPPHIDWDLWLGPAPLRPYHSTYVPFFWRGWWDFGSGNFGDMACHILDAPFWALELGSPARIETQGPPVHPESAPSWVIVHYDFPARGSRPPVRVTWYDGSKAPPKDLLEGIELPGQGSLFIGEKGKLLFPHGNGAVRLFPEQAFAGLADPQPTLPRTQSHHLEWTQACKGTGQTLSGFDYAAALSETVLAGVVAYRVGQPLDWDGPAMKARNAPDAERFIHPEFRSGWTW